MAAADAFRLAAEFEGVSRTIGLRVALVTRHYTMLSLTKVKANASGRPGPNVRTGNYRRSINMRMIRQGPDIVGVVGTNAPQGRRLEYGFAGRDSLGRVYAQSPLPHFGPAMDEIQGPYVAAVAAAALGMKAI